LVIVFNISDRKGAENMSHDVFTSYSRNDQDRMKHIREALENSGLEVWTDTGIKPNTVKLSEI
jgi:hypothetical protein